MLHSSEPVVTNPYLSDRDSLSIREFRSLIKLVLPVWNRFWNPVGNLEHLPCCSK